MSDTNAPESYAQRNWHALATETVLSELDASLSGLSQAEASKRLQRFGANRLRPVKPRSAWLRFASQFNNVLIYVLLGAAVMTAFLRHWIDTGVIIGVVIINALIGFIQEGKAEQALAAIRQMLCLQATVLRDEQWQELPAEQLVPGDIVLLQPGDKIPADLRLLHTKNLQIDESLLTGESVPAVKHHAADPVQAALADRHSMAYSGTLVTYGQAQGVVVTTAEHTEIGHISELLEKVEPLSTPLLRQMADFGRRLTVAILVFAILTAAFGVFIQNYELAEMLLAVVGLSVAAIPEGLPAIMTITLAVGVRRMARRNVIIRHLPAVETLGALTVICSDKTGTLTRNEMTAQSIISADGAIEISGIGYEPYGELLADGKPVALNAMGDNLKQLLRACLLCNDASLRRDSAHNWAIQGDPTEAALLTLASKAGYDLELENKAYPRTDAIPFESEHRFMATLHHDHQGHGCIYIKGAPERILEMCRHQRTSKGDEALKPEYWRQQTDRLAQQGLRVLAIASTPVNDHYHELQLDDINEDLSLLGLVGLIDPPRAEAKQAVEQCHNAGIRVIMITGDHAHTAAAIGAKLGIGDGKTVLNGPELDQLETAELNAKVATVDIFARTSPEHKLKLVSALQSHDHVVVMTGDGVNDAPALRRADVGVAMGNKGTEITKEAGEMVLTDDNFASIVEAIKEGRTVYDNLKKAILFILPTSGGEALIIIAAILFGLTLPITAAQILWVNMVTTVTLALALAFEPPEQGIMLQGPHQPGEPILSGMLLWRIVYVSVIMLAGTFALFIWNQNSGSSTEYARTVAVNTLVMFEIFYLFNSRYITDSAFCRAALSGNRYVWLAIFLLVLLQLAYTYAYPMQMLFGSAALTLTTWLQIILVAASVFVLVELEKWLQLKCFGHNRNRINRASERHS